MILFAASIALFGVTSIPVLAAPIPIILAYSFFDTYSIRNKIGTEKQGKDEYIWNDEILKDINLKSKFKNNTIATILIFVGVYILLNNVILSITYKFEITFLYNVMKILTNYLPSIIIAIISILIGISLIVVGLIIIVATFSTLDILRFMLVFFPLILIITGCEIIYYSRKEEVLVKYDVLGIILTFFVICGWFIFSLVNYGINKILYDIEINEQIKEYISSKS